MHLQGACLKLTSVGLEAAEELLPAFNGDVQFNMWSGVDGGLTLEQVRTDMEETLVMPGGTVWRITDGSAALVGVAETTVVPPPETGWLALLLLRREYQRRGYGTEAATLLENHLLSLPQITRVGLAVLTQNMPGQAFWEGRGYTREMQLRDNHNNDVYTYFWHVRLGEATHQQKRIGQALRHVTCSRYP